MTSHYKGPLAGPTKNVYEDMPLDMGTVEDPTFHMEFRYAGKTHNSKVRLAPPSRQLNGRVEIDISVREVRDGAPTREDSKASLPVWKSFVMSALKDSARAFGKSLIIGAATLGFKEATRGDSQEEEDKKKLQQQKKGSNSTWVSSLLPRALKDAGSELGWSVLTNVWKLAAQKGANPIKASDDTNAEAGRDGGRGAQVDGGWLRWRGK